MHVTVNGVRIHYEVIGNRGKPVLYVHGWGGSLKSLKKLATVMSKKHKGIVIDLPGFGKSDNPDVSWGVDEYAQIIPAFLKEIKIKEVIYFGHSFGGSLGIYNAVHNPDCITKLILCGSAYKRTGKQSKIAVNLKHFVVTYLPFLESIMNTVRPYMYKVFFRNSDLAKFPHLEPNFRKIVTRDLTPLIEHITVPTLILWGQRDTYTPVEMAYELEEKISGSKLVVFPYKRHNLPIRYYEEVVKEMKEFC